MVIIALIAMVLVGLLVFGGHEDDWRDVDANYNDHFME